LRVEGWGFRVEGLRRRVEGWGFRVEGLYVILVLVAKANENATVTAIERRATAIATRQRNK